ncbi:hypothetical protein [Nonomuraea sp. NPDC005650]|uniref:hypothetical protein n=1 Tax=Nonomuraea sp. NPDC005650 TaxID=3157045 RepID=UPI0033B35CA2
MSAAPQHSQDKTPAPGRARKLALEVAERALGGPWAPLWRPTSDDPRTITAFARVVAPWYERATTAADLEERHRVVTALLNQTMAFTADDVVELGEQIVAAAADRHAFLTGTPLGEDLAATLAATGAVLEEQVRRAYQDRAALAALTAALFPAALADDDPASGRTVLYIDLAGRQISYHIDNADLHLFGHVHQDGPEDDPDAPLVSRWDGHDRDTKMARIADTVAELTEHHDPASAIEWLTGAAAQLAPPN